MSSPKTGPGIGRRTILLLILICAAGLTVRFWYLDWRLEAGRFWDERYSFANVRQLQETGDLRPANGYYPLLSYLPQALLLSVSGAVHAVTGVGWLEVHDGSRFTASAYRLARLVQAVWGIGAVWLCFLIGRRLFSDAVGLVAATALAFSPGLIHASAVFKPDAPLVLAVLLAFFWQLAAAHRPTLGRHALAGAGVALAMSTKLTGGLVALPLIFVSALRGRQEPRRIVGLVLAGGVAVVLFLALNPHWPLYFEYLEKLTVEYRWKASVNRFTRWQAPALIGQFLAQNLGVLGVAVAAVAAVTLMVLLARRRLDPATGAGIAMLLFFPPAYVLAYLAKTAQLKSTNFLPILPFVALVTAWGLVQVGRHLGLAEGRPVLLALGLAVVAIAFVPRGLAYVHRSLTPTAEDLAIRFVGRRLHGHPNCQIVYEPGSQRWPTWELAGSFKACRLRQVDRLDELQPAELRLTDGVLFPQERLAGNSAALYLDAVAGSDDENTAVFGGRGLRVRGPGFVAAVHPWDTLAPPRELQLRVRETGRFRLEADMPVEVEAGDVVSFSVWIPRDVLAESMSPPRLRMGRHIVDLLPAELNRRGGRFLSPRLVSRQPAPHARLNRARLGSTRDYVRLTLWRWRQKEQPEPHGAAERSVRMRQSPSSSTSSRLLRTTSE